MAGHPGATRRWFLQLFGGYRLKDASEAQSLAPQEMFLMVVLAVAARPVSRSTLIYLLWDDHGERTLRHRLSQLCLSLRKRLAETPMIVASGDTLSLNRTLVRTDLDQVADDARRGDHDRMMATLDLGFPLPRSWLSWDDRIHGWVIPEFRQHTKQWERSFERLGERFPIATDLGVDEEFGMAVARPRERDIAVETPIHFLIMIRVGLEMERQRGNATGLQLLLGQAKAALSQLHPSSLAYVHFLALFSQRALWDEGTGGGADALAALRGYQNCSDGKTAPEDLYPLLPVLEVEGLLQSPTVAEEVRTSIRASLAIQTERDGPMDCLARARLAIYAQSVGLLTQPESDGTLLLQTSGRVQDRWLLLEFWAHEALRRRDPAQAAVHFRLLLHKAEAAWDYPAIAIATAGLLRLTPDPVPIPEVRRLIHRLPSHIRLPRRERSILGEARRHWTDGAGESTVSLSLPATPLLQLRTPTDAPSPSWTLQPPLRWMDRGHHRRHVFREIRRADAAGAARHDRAKADPGLQVPS